MDPAGVMQKQASNESKQVKIALDEHLLPLAPPAAAIAVEEDEYLDGLSAIIQRDFYPQLAQLKNTQMGKIVLPEASNELLGTNINMNLDAFQYKFTSQDNASFQSILYSQNQRNRERYKHLYVGETQKRIGDQEKLLLETSEHISKSVGEWEFTVFVKLIYGRLAMR